jgi:hypothetical protein
VGQKPNTTEFPLLLLKDSTGATFRAASYVTGDFNEAWRYTVRAQEEATFGFGKPGDEVNQGFLFVDLRTVVPADIDGVVRFQMEGAHGDAIPGGLVREEDSARLDASQTDRRLMVPLPQWPLWATEDSRLVLRINPSATASGTLADSTLQIPATVRRKTK